MPTHLILTKTLSSIHKHNSSFTDKATIQRVQGPCSRSHTWYVAELWVRPGRLIPEPVLLTPEVHVDPWSSRGHSWVTAGLVSSLKLPSFKFWMGLDTEISLCVREDKPSSEGELVHVNLHPQLWGRGCCLDTACQPWVNPSFQPTPSL